MWVPEPTVHYYITENIIRWLRRQTEASAQMKNIDEGCKGQKGFW